MLPKRTWILVADATRARVLKDEGRGAGLEPALDRGFHHPLEPVHEMGSERPGHGHQSANAGRFAIEPRADWARAEHRHFADELSHALEAHARAKDFDRLVLIAPSRMLGELRHALGRDARALLHGEIAKDLTEHSVQTVAEHLIEHRLI
ncbi:MAG TPA: host attachment protein [Alphaproteobacteria bacterium]|nr:host attachment protein [Alphaproteobacteria bacterium]